MTSSAKRRINGQICKVAVIELAEKMPHPIQRDGARKIWERALDGNKISEDEINAMNHIRENLPLTDDAREFFKYWLKEKRVTKITGSASIVVNGVRCDKPMIDVANIFKSRAKGGPLTLFAAEGVWFCALDGRGVTKTEKETLKVIYDKYVFEERAKTFLEIKLRWLDIAQSAAEVPAVGERVSIKPDATLLKFADAVALGDRELLSDSLTPKSPDTLCKISLPVATVVLGCRVRITGLDDPALNDLEGTCDEWDAGKNQWIVRSAKGAISTLPAENLQVVPAIGSIVALQCLKSCPELNDTQGSCEGYNKDECAWMVKIHTGEVKPIKSENLRVLAVIGSKVQLHSLQSSPELNGTVGICENWDETKGRWTVRSEDGEVKCAKPENLKIYDESSERSSRKRKRQEDKPGLKLQQLRDIFEMCDRNKDGSINKRELIMACRQRPEVAEFFQLPTTIRQEDGSRSKFEELFQDITTNTDREICWAELLAYYKHLVVDF